MRGQWLGCMLRGTLSSLVAILLTGCALSSSTVQTTSSGVTGRAELPVYALGDRWIRSDGIYELIRVENDRYVFSGESGLELHLSKDLFLVKSVYQGRVSYEFASASVLSWPLEIGKRGTAFGNFRALDGTQSYPGELTWVVEAYEDVKVAAGTFKAFRVAATIQQQTNPDRPSRSNVRAVRYRFWYAPEARQFVKADGEWYMHFEVIAVDPEHTAPLKVELREPKDQGRFGGSGEISVTGNVTGGKGVAQVTTSLNGEVVSRDQSSGNAKRAVVLNVPLRLRAGKNVLLVTATDPGGVATQEARTLFYAPPLRVSLPPAGQPVRVSHDEIILGGRLQGPWPSGFHGYALALNGAVMGGGDLAEKSEVSFETAMRLRDGENLVTLHFFGQGAPETPQEWTLILDRTAAAPEQVTASAPDETSGKKITESSPPPQPSLSPAIGASPAAAPPPVPSSAPSPAVAAPLAPVPSPSSEIQKPAGVPSATHPPSSPGIAEQPAPPPSPPANLASSPIVVAPPPPSLQVTLSSPQDQSRVEQETVALAGLVSSSKGVGRIIVALNGAEISRREEPTSQRTVAVNVPVALREGQNTLVVTASDTDGTVSQEVRTVYFERRMPLTVAFRYPQDMARVTEAATIVAALVASSKGVSKVSITLNGAEVHQQTERSPEKSVVVALPLKLSEGANTIGITASEADGTTRQELRTVIFDRSQMAVASPPPLPPPPTQNRWAVVIGVGAYDSADIPRLRYAVRDAEAIYQVLTGLAGFKKEHVLLLTDATERKPTLRNIRWALGTFLARSARRDDTVVIFFAGHGAPETDLRGIERDGLAKYLIPGDADAEDLYSSALPMDELQTIFGRIEAERVVAFLDTCYSGAAGGRTFLTKRTRSSQVDDLFLERLTRAKGRAIITASRPAEVSMELAEFAHGIFTYYLLEGLKGAADLNRDGIVTVQELYEYVEQQVTQKSRSVGGNQHPVMKGELEGVIPLVKVRGR